jgi:hypothetical protein
VKRHDPITSWQNLVTEYSASKLTNGSYLLPALAGIVQHEVHFRIGDVYVVGMWKNALIEDLWFYVGGGSVSNLDAPSWSWACL